MDADLERPSLHELFGLTNSDGTSLVLGEASTLDAALQHVDVALE